MPRNAVRAAVDRVALAVEPAFEPAFRAYGDYFTRFELAPLVIVPIYDLNFLTRLDFSSPTVMRDGS
jgi:hypothetical protein